MLEIKDVVLKKGRGLLLKAQGLLKDKFKFYSFIPLRDQLGAVFAYETDRYLLVAKASPYGWIISVHSSALDYAIKHQKKILMYIDSSESFYVFESRDICADKCFARNNRISKSGVAIPMVNFSIRTGRNFEKEALAITSNLNQMGLF